MSAFICPEVQSLEYLLRPLRCMFGEIKVRAVQHSTAHKLSATTDRAETCRQRGSTTEKGVLPMQTGRYLVVSPLI